jgi:hypothetical protein
VRLMILLLAAAIVPAARPAGAPHQGGQAQPGRLDSLAVTRSPERSVVGTLESVDPKTMQIVVSSASGTQTLHLRSSVTIRQGSKMLKASELPAHRGERVKVRYRESGGLRQAEWIVLASPAARHPGHSSKP